MKIITPLTNKKGRIIVAAIATVVTLMGIAYGITRLTAWLENWSVSFQIPVRNFIVITPRNLPEVPQRIVQVKEVIKEVPAKK